MSASHRNCTGKRLAGLTLGALGVVYGDIGTSPLYAFKECFDPKHGIRPEAPAVVGVLSLIIWSLILVVTIKYLVFVLQADNKGEGGILALLSLAFPVSRAGRLGRTAQLMIGVGVAGSCLLYGDGIITPAISVLGAVEGLKVATHTLDKVIVPISVVIIILLFAAQRAGTAKVGRIFGPVTLLWFLAIAVIGVRGILTRPEILAAFNPIHGLSFLATHGRFGLAVLGSVVLAITGGEALYADMGHFGPRPIRVAWYSVVMPSLLLNYLGQGALLLSQPGLAASDSFNPFYQLCPRWAIYPMVGLATAAAIIASQALISGAFSMTMHAIQLGYMPRLVIEHTSERERGQIYMPQVNWFLMLACIGLIVGFGSSDRLAGAYGIAVTFTMMTTTALLYFAAQRVFGWSKTQAGLVCGLFLAIEAPFAIANLLKIGQGGWFPLLVAGGIYVLMSTWKRGRQIVWERIRSSAMPATKFVEDMKRKSPHRVAGTAVYMAGNSDGTPIALLHNLKHNKVLHQRIVFLTVVIEEDSHVSPSERLEVEELDAGFWRVRARYGFMEEPNVQAILNLCATKGLEFKPMETTFFLSRETIIPSHNNRSGMATWRDRVFAVMARNATSATAFFRLPANRVVELGMQVEI